MEAMMHYLVTGTGKHCFVVIVEKKNGVTNIFIQII